jgi:Rap1a immunity proteins
MACAAWETALRRYLGDLGYVNGIVDMEKKFGQSRHFCIPPRMSMGKMITGMVADLADHPRQLERPAADAAVESLSRTFPCAAPK